MWTSAWLHHNTKSKPPQEGELYKILELHQHRFELRYGYYDARERANPLIPGCKTVQILEGSPKTITLRSIFDIG